MRLCEALHFNEDGPRHIPALAAAAQTPALPQLLQPSPGPAAPAAPSPARTAPGGCPAHRHKDPGQRLSTDRCVVCLHWGRELRGRPAAGCRGTRAWRTEQAPPSVRRRPARCSSKGATRLASPAPPEAVCAGGRGTAGTCLFCLVTLGLKRGVGRAGLLSFSQCC